MQIPSGSENGAIPSVQRELLLRKEKDTLEEQKKTPLTEEELLKREQALESREEELNAKET